MVLRVGDGYLTKALHPSYTQMKIHRSIITLGILLGGITVGNATNIGFGTLGGNNTTVPVNLGSFATVNGPGYVVSLGGATPNIGLTWDSGRPSNEWDIHRSAFFAPLENQFVGGGDWDKQGADPQIGQLDFGLHTILFTINDPGYALKLDSFDFGHTAETAGTTQWTLTLTNSISTVVWNQNVTFTNGQVYTITPNFTGLGGESYLLTFTRISETYGSNGRHGIDNLQFSQVVAVPEPATYGIAFATLLGVVVLVRRRAIRNV